MNSINGAEPDVCSQQMGPFPSGSEVHVDLIPFLSIYQPHPMSFLTTLPAEQATKIVYIQLFQLLAMWEDQKLLEVDLLSEN